MLNFHVIKVDKKKSWLLVKRDICKHPGLEVMSLTSFYVVQEQNNKGCATRRFSTQHYMKPKVQASKQPKRGEPPRGKETLRTKPSTGQMKHIN
jgi:hypothetical protein